MSSSSPRGWSEWLRRDATKAFIEISDDGSDLAALGFDAALAKKLPAQFGDGTHRNYVFHTIAGLRENNPPTMPWLPADPIQMLLCTRGGNGGAVANGIEYQKLSVLTGGLRFPICEYENFDAVFREVASGVVKSALVECEFSPPLPPAKKRLDWKTVIVDYTPGAGPTTNLQRVSGPALCGRDRFYITNDRVYLCQETCKQAKADPTSRVDVLWDCDRSPG